MAGEGGGWAAKDLTRAVAVMQRPPEAPERTEGGGFEQIEIVDRAVLALEEVQKKRKAQKGGTSREHREAAKGEAGAEVFETHSALGKPLGNPGAICGSLEAFGAALASV